MTVSVSVLQEHGETTKKKWIAAGLHPTLYAVGCGTADFDFPDDEYEQAM